MADRLLNDRGSQVQILNQHTVPATTVPATNVISQEIGKSEPAEAGSGLSVSGLIVALWVDGEFSEEFAGDGVDDADFEGLDERDDVGSRDTDVVHSAACRCDGKVRRRPRVESRRRPFQGPQDF